MKRKKSRLSEILQALKETGKSYWELIGNPLPEYYNGKGATYSNTEWDSVSLTPERFYTGADENEDSVVGQENLRAQYALRNGRPMPRRNNEEITQEELAAIKAARTEEAKKHPVKKYKVFPGLQKGLSRETSLVDSVANGINRQVETAKIIHKANQQAQRDAEQKRRAFAHDLKTGLNAAATATELALSGGTLLGAYGNWKKWATSGNKLKSGIANWLTSHQLPMQIGGVAIDGYQTYDAIQNENTRNAIYNTMSLGLGAAGTIGAADVFRNTKPWVDRALDAAGVTQAATDFVKFGYDNLFGYSSGKELAVDQLTGSGRELDNPRLYDQHSTVTMPFDANWALTSGMLAHPTAASTLQDSYDSAGNPVDLNVTLKEGPIITAQDPRKKYSYSEINPETGHRLHSGALRQVYPEFDMLLGGKLLHTDVAGLFAKDANAIINNTANVSFSDGPNRSFFRKVWDWFHDIPWSNNTTRLAQPKSMNETPLDIRMYGSPVDVPGNKYPAVGEIGPTKRMRDWAGEQLRRLLNFGVDVDMPVRIDQKWMTPRLYILESATKPAYISNDLSVPGAYGMYSRGDGTSFIRKSVVDGKPVSLVKSVQMHESSSHGTDAAIRAANATNTFLGSPMKLYRALLDELELHGLFKNRYSGNEAELRSTMTEMANKIYDTLGKDVDISNPEVRRAFESYVDGLSNDQLIKQLRINAYGYDYANTINKLLTQRPEEANYIMRLIKEGLKKFPMLATPVAGGATVASLDAAEQSQDRLKLYNKGKNNDVVFGGTLPEIVITAKQLNRTVNNSVERTLLDIQRRNSLRYGMMRYIFDDSLTPPKPLLVRIQEEDEWKPIEMYKKGKPSQRLRRLIAEWEGTDFAEQQGKFGDAVGKFYEWTRQQVGDKIWDKLTPNQRDALTSYRYNIKYGSFAPTVEALNTWYKTPTPENLNAVRNTINVGMNRKGMSGLRKRRLAEQDWFMEGVENLPPKEPTFDVQKPVITVSTLRKPVRQEDVTLPLEDDVQPVQDVRIPYRPVYFSNAMEEFRKSILGFNGGKNNQVVDANNAAHYMSGGVGVPVGTIEDDGSGVDYIVNVPEIDVLGTTPKGNRSEIIDGKPFVRPLQLDHTFETILLPMAGAAAKAGGKMAYNNAMKYIDEKIMPNFGYWGDGSRTARVYGTLARRYNLPHKANYPEAYRKLRDMDEYTSARWNMSKTDGNPFVSSDGHIYMGNPNMSKERMDIMSTKGGHVNFTTDQPVLDHGSNSWANGSVWAINPNAVINNETVPYLKSIEPMDMFFDGLPKQLLKYNPKDLTLISGNPSHIQFARDHGVGVLTNKNVQNLWNEARKRELQPLAKSGPTEYKEYSRALSKLVSRRGRPDVKDYLKLQDFTKLNSFVSGDKKSLLKLEKQLRKVSDGNISINDVTNMSLRYPNGRDVGISPKAANKHINLLNLANFNKVWYDPAPQSEYLYFNGLYNPYGSLL